MAEPSESTGATQEPQGAESAGQQQEPPRPRTDWKAECRKWEQRAKQNEAALSELKAKQERASAVSAAAEKHGVPADVLSRMEGDPEESAALLAKALSGKAYPQTRDNGDGGKPHKPDQYAEAARLVFGRK